MREALKTITIACLVAVLFSVVVLAAAGICVSAAEFLEHSHTSCVHDHRGDGAGEETK